MTTILNPALKGLAAVLSVTIALFSYRYLLGGNLLAPPNIMANFYHRPWLYVHAGGGATALLLASFQMTGGLRRRFPALHRWLGRIYAVAGLVGGGTGLICAFGTSSGSVATVGFGAQAVISLVAITQGWRFALVRRFAEHRAWMIRSFALTFGAVMMRVNLPLLVGLGLPFERAYVLDSYLCWIPNLLVAELYLRGAFRSPVNLSVLRVFGRRGRADRTEIFDAPVE